MNTPHYLKGRLAFLIEEVKDCSNRRFRLRMYSDLAATMVVLDAFFTGIENMYISNYVISAFFIAVIVDYSVPKIRRKKGVENH